MKNKDKRRRFLWQKSKRSEKCPALLEQMPNQLIETEVEVDPMAELAGVYRYVGAGGTVKRPTKEGPAMIFNRIKGHPDARVAIGASGKQKKSCCFT